MFKKKRIWLVMAVLVLTSLLWGCTHLFGPAGLNGVNEQGAFQPSSAAADQFEVVSGKVRVLISFIHRPGPSDEALIRGVGGVVRYTYHLIPAIAATIPETAIGVLQGNRNVTHVAPDVRVHALDTELDNSWGVKRIGAGIVHDSGNKGAGVKVAIIDTGIDYTHPDLDANYKGGYDFVNNDPDPMDDNGHGTHVAGIVGAEDNDAGVVGVAPEVSLYALKVLDESGSGYYSDIIAALQWCVDNGIQVTNNSYGSSLDPGETVKAAFDNAYAAGILHVAAAGNSGNPPGKGDNVSYPARWDSVIAVAATDKDDARARWSSTGPDLELSAPGVDIYSTYPGGGYATMSGTSMASPHVAGTAALVWVAYPDWSNADVRAQLQNTADDLGAVGWDSKYGYGLVDADEAAGVTPPPPVTGTMHVSSIDMSLKTAGPWVNAIATVTIVDADSNPVEGATVSGHWSGLTSDIDSGTTDTSGQVSFQSDRVRSPSSGSVFAFCVDDATKAGWVYDSSVNTETCDSIQVP